MQYRHDPIAQCTRIDTKVFGQQQLAKHPEKTLGVLPRIQRVPGSKHQAAMLWGHGIPPYFTRVLQPQKHLLLVEGRIVAAQRSLQA
ncbi:hypothetical protein D3C72_2217130 [compost metagenome]